MKYKPTFDLDNCSYDDIRQQMAGSDDKIPPTWWKKTMQEKRKWLEKKLKHDQRFVHVDTEHERARTVKLRIYQQLNKKKRAQMADIYSQLGIN